MEQELALLSAKGWKQLENVIEKSFSFDSTGGVSPFLKGLGLIQKVAELAEAANHHPDIHFTYNRVVISLTTHDKGSLTQKDIDLAKQIEAVIESSGA